MFQLQMFICGSVTCPPPALSRASYARIYPSTRPKFHKGERVPVFRGYITYYPGRRLPYQPEVGTKIEAICLEGFWVMRSDVRNVPEDIEELECVLINFCV